MSLFDFTFTHPVTTGYSHEECRNVKRRTANRKPSTRQQGVMDVGIRTGMSCVIHCAKEGLEGTANCANAAFARFTSKRMHAPPSLMVVQKQNFVAMLNMLWLGLQRGCLLKAERVRER